MAMIFGDEGARRMARTGAWGKGRRGCTLLCTSHGQADGCACDKVKKPICLPPPARIPLACRSCPAPHAMAPQHALHPQPNACLASPTLHALHPLPCMPQALPAPPLSPSLPLATPRPPTRRPAAMPDLLQCPAATECPGCCNCSTSHPSPPPAPHPTPLPFTFTPHATGRRPSAQGPPPPTSQGPVFKRPGSHSIFALGAMSQFMRSNRDATIAG
jgi:hypothetical protein